MFGFIRQEIARAATATSAQGAAAPSPVDANKSGERESEGGDAEVELADKRDVVLSKLPQLMELNKVCCGFVPVCGAAQLATVHERGSSPPSVHP